MIRDFILDATGDLKIENGDVAIGDATVDNQRLLLLIQKGELKQYPTRCVGALEYLDDENPQDFAREVRRQFELDGMRVGRLTYTGGKLTFDAHYK